MQGVKITCEATIKLVLTPFAIDMFTRDGNRFEPKWEERLFFCADAKGFDCEVARDGQFRSGGRFCFDGTTYSSHEQDGECLVISKSGAFTFPEGANMNPMLLLPGMFRPDRNRQIDCRWPDAISPAFWTSLPAVFSTAPFGETSAIVDGNRITVTVPDKASPLGFSVMETHPSTYPDRPLLKYTVTEIGEIPFDDKGQKKTFYYPRKALFQMYEDTGDLTRTDTQEVTRITINDPAFDESKFVPARTGVKYLWDVDTHKYLPVTK
jgi:hypothetical protein